MSQSLSFTRPDPAYPVAADCGGAALMSKLIYRSRAVNPLSSLELYKLALAAQSRNRAEFITGLVLYDKDSFFQWLEGPAESLERIMCSIRNDPRHTDIEVLENRSAGTRMFAEWSMKLAATGEPAEAWRRDVLQPPPRIIKSLRRNPQAAPHLLPALMPFSSGILAEKVTEFRPSSRVKLNHHAAAMLKTVILERVIPELLDQHNVLHIGARPLPVHKRVWELADLLLAADQAAAFELIREVQSETVPILLHYATLFEPAARRLGDLWGEDICTELDVTLGMSRIQSAVRMLNAKAARRTARGAPGPVILIAPEPGEMHSLGAALDSEVMWNVGWNPHCEYPRDDHALEDLVAAKWFDVLDLSLSTAFRREHWLPRLKKSIAAAREASRNPALVVVVGGRLFAERLAVGAQVGADAASMTALQVNRSIMDRWRKEP